jgi:hypothetical protein
MKAIHHETKNPVAPNMVRDERGDSWDVVAEDYDNNCIVQHCYGDRAALFKGDPVEGNDELIVVPNGAMFVDYDKNRWTVSDGRWIRIASPEKMP